MCNLLVLKFLYHCVVRLELLENTCLFLPDLVITRDHYKTILTIHYNLLFEDFRSRLARLAAPIGPGVRQGAESPPPPPAGNIVRLNTPAGREF